MLQAGDQLIITADADAGLASTFTTAVAALPDRLMP